MACQVIKGNERMCRNYARKGMTCCYSHRVLENTQFVLKNETEFKLQERRIRVFKGIDWNQGWGHAMEAMNRKMLEDDSDEE